MKSQWRLTNCTLLLILFLSGSSAYSAQTQLPPVQPTGPVAETRPDSSQPNSSQPDPPAAPQVPVADGEKVPFAFADFSWLSGNPRTKQSPLGNEYFTGEFRVDGAYHYSFNKPVDDTISGSSEVFRSGEFQVTQLGIGGDFHYNNVQGRLMTQFGMYSQTTPRNDASPRSAG